MSVIIRLQNLPWSANALDIRQFFSGLGIPEGGVHIVGGELGDAFIAFSTDEDARQAFNLNGGKLKEVQIKLMLSSRTEMQKVIEAARNPLAAFMQATPAAPQPLPAIIPAAVPPVIPEIKKDDKDKLRERRRSRSRSRDRKERSRERDRRRRRDRSRSRSRDRRDRRRRDRSHSRERRSSKDRDRRSKESRRSEDKTSSNSNSSGTAQKDQSKVGIWEDPVRSELTTAIQANPALHQALLNNLMPNNLEEARRNLNALAPASLLMGNRNGLQAQAAETFMGRGRDNWNNGGAVGQNVNTGRPDFASRYNRNTQGTRGDETGKFNALANRAQLNNQAYEDIPRMGYNRMNARFDQPERQGLLELPGLLERPSLLERPMDDAKECCVQLSPYYGGYGEVRKFFQGLFIQNTGIKFINDENGKRTGIVYIRFATDDGKKKALLRNGELLKNQKVEVIHLDNDIFQNTVDRYQPEYKESMSPDRSRRKKANPILSQFSCLAVENLPLFTKEQDMLKIFSEYSLLSILLVNKQRHVTAYIKFADFDNAKRAEMEKSKHIFDGKPLAIRPCSDEEFAIISHDDQEDTDDVIEVIEDDDEDEDDKNYPPPECVELNGLPLKTTDRDVSDFFSDVAIVPSKIHFLSSNLGFTGTAYCEFSSAEDAEIALEKNGLPLGSGVVTVTSVSRQEMESKVGIISSANFGSKNMQNSIRPPFHQQRGGYGRGGHGPRGGGMMGHRPAMRRFRPTPTPDPNEMAPPGHTVRMENVPYKAVLDEILEFFEGFDVPADNVLRRYNENGTPSGEAKVIFKSAKEAHEACQARHRSKIRDRTVFLYQC